MNGALLFAIGVAASPVPIGASLLLLTGQRPAANGAAFALGWIVGLSVVAGAFVLLVPLAGLTDSDPLWIALMELLIGVGLLGASVGTWIRHRSGPRMAPALLLGALDRLTPTRSAGAGVVISGANPKVLALALGEALAVTAAGADPDARTPSIVLFVAIGATGVVLPLAAYLLLHRARAPLLGIRAWLNEHEVQAVVGLGLVIGTAFLADGLRPFAS